MRRLIQSLTDLVSGTPSTSHQPLYYATGGWKTARSPVLDVRAYGAVGDNSTDDTTSIQAAIDAADAISGGATVYFPPGVYVTQTLALKYQVSLIGASGLFPSNATGAVLKLKANTNAPILINDSSGGGVAGTSTIGGGSQRYQYSTIDGITFDGNKSNQTSMAADCIRLTAAWHVTIKNCGIIHARGFGLRALDCNVLTIRNNHFIFAPVYLESLADSIVTENQIGGGTGYVYPCLWLASAGEACWQNLLTENFIFNNSNNTAISFPTATFDAGSDEATTSAPHGWADGTPVIVTTSGTLPGGLTAGKTYYVKSTGAAALKLATTRADLDAERYVNISSTGSGTHTIQVGENCGLYLSDAETKWNVIGQSRLDQNYGHGIVCDASPENVLTGNLVNTSGYNNGTGKHGVHLRNGAVRNAISGGAIDGSAYTAGYTANQVIGVYADATSYDTRIATGTLIEGHTTANVQLVNYTGNPEFITLGPDRFIAVSGTPVTGTAGGGRRIVWLFDASADELIATTFMTPLCWRTLKITALWVNAGAGAGDVTWALNVGQYVDGESLNAADALSAETTTTAGLQDVLTTTVFSNIEIAEGEPVFLRVKRTGTAVGDTLGNDAGLVLVRVERA